MKARKTTMETLRRHIRASEQDALKAQMKHAGLPDDDVRAAGVARPSAGDDGGGPSTTMRRNIPKDYDYDPRAMKPLAQMLWALSISLGHVMTAHRQFVKIKSATISPDGLIGGRGYVMSVKDVRQALHDACESISSVSDTVHDELHAPHWRTRLAELEGQDVESVERLVGDAERVLENPEHEAFVEEGMQKAQQQGEQAELEQHEGGSPPSDERFEKPKPPPFLGEGNEEDEDEEDEDEDEDEDESGAQLPDGEGLADSSKPQVKTASAYSLLSWRVANRYANGRRADSSLPVETLPGPRVPHLDRGDVDQTGPFGSYNSEEQQSMSDDWSRTDGVGDDFAYESEWDNELLDKTAESLSPGRYTDVTPTEAWDFGVGYGNGDDAHGQGAGGYGIKNEDGKGFYSPASKLPSDPAGVTTDETDDTTAQIDAQIGVSNRNAQAKLPNDGEPGVARSDYYRGDKGSNLVNGDSELPSEADLSYDYSMDAQPGVGYRYEQSQPYVKWDHTTHNMRQDDLYQRDDEEGPYVKQGEKV